MRLPKKIRHWLPLALCCLLPAIGAGGQTLPPLAPDAVILCFGDSLTYGAGADERDSYPAVLARLTGRKVVNSGISGESSPYGLRRLPGALDEARPQLLILCHGCNDLRDRDPAELERIRAGLRNNLRRMLALAKSRGIATLLLAVPEVKLVAIPGRGLEGLDYKAAPPPPLYAELAEEFDIPLEPDILLKVIGDRSLKSDILHPNAAGYREIAEAVARVLRQSGAIP